MLQPAGDLTDADCKQSWNENRALGFTLLVKCPDRRVSGLRGPHRLAPVFFSARSSGIPLLWDPSPGAVPEQFLERPGGGTAGLRSSLGTQRRLQPGREGTRGLWIRAVPADISA